MDEEAYSTVPKGCAPLAVVVCATWQSVLVVEEYCQRLMSRVSGFKSLALMDGTVRTLNDSVSSMTNGLTLLAATAPALAFLSERSQVAFSFSHQRLQSLKLARSTTSDRIRGSILEQICRWS